MRRIAIAQIFGEHRREQMIMSLRAERPDRQTNWRRPCWRARASTCISSCRKPDREPNWAEHNAACRGSPRLAKAIVADVQSPMSRFPAWAPRPERKSGRIEAAFRAVDLDLVLALPMRRMKRARAHDRGLFGRRDPEAGISICEPRGDGAGPLRNIWVSNGLTSCGPAC